MRRLSVPPDAHTFPFALKACDQLRSASLYRTLQCQSFKFGFAADIFVVNCLIRVYSFTGRIYDAHQVFEKSPYRDVVSYNALVDGFVKAGETRRACQLFEEMPVRDAVSWGTLIAGYAVSWGTLIPFPLLVGVAIAGILKETAVELSPLLKSPLKPGLYLVGTPIGNLEDITLRALRVLRSTDVILAEDTSHSGKLLQHYDIKTPFLSYHKFNESRREQAVLKKLRQGEIVAQISDSGTPGMELRADVWSCGVTLYVMLVSACPFEDPEDPRNFLKTIQRILNVQYTIPDYVHISPECRHLISRIFVADPGQRITIPEVRNHEWFLKNLPADLMDDNSSNQYEEPDQPVQSIDEIM